jgi:hypothetical protein
VTTRILPPEEYPRLAGTELELVWPTLPMDAAVVVVEDGGEIIGCWAAFLLAHVEGVWVAPAHRGKTSVARRLLGGMRRALAEHFGASGAITGAMSDEVRGILAGLGATKLPGDHYTLTLGVRRATCQQP